MSETPGARSLQDRYMPHGICFGCGPANEQGLRIESFAADASAEAEVVARFTPAAHHQAFPGVVNGGIIGTLLDCQGNWTAARYLMRRAGVDVLPSTVTMDFHVRLRRPTPVVPLELRANVVEVDGDQVTVEASVEAAGKVTATMTGHFVAVRPGHPAYHPT